MVLCTCYRFVFFSFVPSWFFSLLSYLSACLHGHPHVPWWISLVPASSINWREATPTHQDGSHLRAATSCGLAYSRDPSYSLSHTHAIPVGVLPPFFPFPDDEFGQSLREAPHRNLYFCNKAQCFAVAASSSPAPQARKIRISTPSASTSQRLIVLSSIFLDLDLFCPPAISFTRILSQTTTASTGQATESLNSSLLPPGISIPTLSTTSVCLFFPHWILGWAELHHPVSLPKACRHLPLVLFSGDKLLLAVFDVSIILDYIAGAPDDVFFCWFHF